MTTGARQRAGVRLLVLAALLLTGAAAAAQSVTLRVDRQKATLDDSITLEVRATGDFDELVPPPTPGFDVSGRSQSSQFSIVGRQMTREQVLRLGLVPVQVGKQTIGPAELRKDGRVVARSDVLSVQIRDDGSDPVSAGAVRDLEPRAGEPLFLVPTFPNRPVYVGEPFVLTYSLYIRRDVDVMSSNWKREPDLSGFAAEDLMEDQRPRVLRQRLGKFVYSVAVQSQSLVVPLTPGDVTVGAATVDVIVGDVFSRRNYAAKAPPFRLQVREVPKAGRPPEYRDGNIGRFDLAVELRPTDVRAGERVVLTLRVSGQGALESVQTPTLPPLAGAEVEPLPSADADTIEKTRSGVTGTRVFQWVLVPTVEGDLRLPSIRFGYFDPEKQRFAVASTEPLSVQVEGVAPVPVAHAAAAAATPAVGLRDIRAESDLASHRPRPLHGSLWYWLLLAVPAALVVVVELATLAARRRRANAGRIRVRKARSAAERYLREAEAHARGGRTTELFAEVARGLDRYCTDRFGLSLKGRTHQSVRKDLAERGADEALADDLVTELENCDYARFAPVAVRADEMRASLDRARALLARLDALPARTPGGEEAV